MVFRRVKGFTLIELLVVIAIIGVLSTLAIVALGSARLKARDSKRVSDLTQVGKALELYYSTNNSYPTTITAGQAISDSSTAYLSAIPSNPTPRTDGSCPDQDYQYYYITATNTYVVAGCIGGSTGVFSPGPVGYHTSSGLLNCGGPVIDADGNSYRTVQLGGQCWMAENLRVGVQDNDHPANNGIIEKACYADNSANCLTDGGLYEWDEAMGYVTTAGAQGICPAGWHIPTVQEMNTLQILFANSGAQCDPFRSGYQCVGSADKLKLAGKCNGRTPCGSTAFNMLMAGDRGNITLAYANGPNASGAAGSLWTSTMLNGASSYYEQFLPNQQGINEGTINKANAFSIRCIKG